MYIREAHPTDGWRMNQNDRVGIAIEEPKSAEAREDVASTCVQNLKLSIPTVIDNMQNTTEKAYAGWPDRIYVIGKDGNVAFKGGTGPRNFNPKLAEEALKRLLQT